MFLLAYMNGNAELCKSALRCGVCLAVTNNYGVSVFNYETPTKQLLFSLLGELFTLSTAAFHVCYNGSWGD